MKKITLSIAALTMAAVFTTGLISCNEKKNNDAAAKTETAAPAQVQEVAAPAQDNKKDELIKRQVNGIYINANDLQLAVVDNVLVDSESGFTLNASEEKVMEVKKCDQRQIGEELFTQAISTKGSGKYTVGDDAINYRTISFPAKAGDSIIVYTTSSSKTDSRPLHVVNMATAEEIGTIDMMPDNGKDMTVDEVIVKEDGNYCVYATSGTGYIYQIKVGK